MRETYPDDVKMELEEWGKQFWINAPEWPAIPFEGEYEIETHPSFLVQNGVRACANDLIYNYEKEIGVDYPIYGQYDGCCYWSGDIFNIDYWRDWNGDRFCPLGLTPTTNEHLLMLVSDCDEDELYYMLMT